MLTITHTHEAGTLIDGTSKGDGTAAILKANGWRWGRSIGTWYVANSRDHLPKSHVIKRTVAALEAAGYDVAPLELDYTARDTAEVEADKIARQSDRIDAFAAKADRKAAAATAAWNRHERDVAHLPEGGEPIKVGHHSEGRHRRALEKAHNSMGRYVQASEDADRADASAKAAEHTTAARYSPVTVSNRIDKLAAEIRKMEREIDAQVWSDDSEWWVDPSEEEKAKRTAYYGPAIAERRNQLTYWESIRETQKAEGIRAYGPDTVNKGDAVKIRGAWHRVARANTKTVSVETGYSWTDRSPWAEVQDHRAASETPAAE